MNQASFAPFVSLLGIAQLFKIAILPLVRHAIHQFCVGILRRGQYVVPDDHPENWHKNDGGDSANNKLRDQIDGSAADLPTALRTCVRVSTDVRTAIGTWHQARAIHRKTLSFDLAFVCPRAGHDSMAMHAS